MESKSETIKNNAKQDLFSSLPDDLLHHILSFLDMIFVVKTSILSKRWRYLWTYVQILNFNIDNYVIGHPISTGLDSFISFVEMVLCHRTDTNIKTFQILDKHKHHSCVTEGMQCCASRIDTWTHVAVSNNVEELDLQINCRLNLKLPRCIFTCKSLTTLKLHYGAGSFLEFPETIDLPSLRNLHLRLIQFHCEEMSNFVSSCSVLERLTINNCYLSSRANNLTISSLQLKELDMKLTDSRGISSEYPGYSSVTVSAPRLLSFTCRSFTYKDYSKMHYYNLADISSLVRVKMELGSVVHKAETKWTNKDVERLIKCLQGVSAVRSLTLSLSGSLLKSFFDVHTGSRGAVITSFCNLNVLTLKAVRSGFCVHFVMYLLEKCPNLETFILDTTTLPLIYQVKYGLKKHSNSWIAELQLECMHHLKLIEFKGLVGFDVEFDFLKIFLKKAIMLEKMIVTTSEAQSIACQGTIKKFRADLPTFPS